jgi:hypothetical protein
MEKSKSLYSIIAIIIIFILSGCQSNSNNIIISEVYDSGQIIECSFVELPPEGMLELEQYEVVLSYQKSNVRIELKNSDTFLLITENGTIEPLNERRHAQIYEPAKNDNCEYIRNSELTYNLILLEKHGFGLVNQMFGGVPFIINDKFTISNFEKENKEKKDFTCKVEEKDSRFDINGKICETRDYSQFFVNR